MKKFNNLRFFGVYLAMAILAMMLSTTAAFGQEKNGATAALPAAAPVATLNVQSETNRVAIPAVTNLGEIKNITPIGSDMVAITFNIDGNTANAALPAAGIQISNLNSNVKVVTSNTANQELPGVVNSNGASDANRTNQELAAGTQPLNPTVSAAANIVKTNIDAAALTVNRSNLILSPAATAQTGETDADRYNLTLTLINRLEQYAASLKFKLGDPNAGTVPTEDTVQFLVPGSGEQEAFNSAVF